MIDLKKHKTISFDTECTGLNPWGDAKRWGFHPARPFAYSFSTLNGKIHFIRWKVNPKTREVLPDKKDFSFIQDVLEDERIIKVGHNIGFDIRMSEMMGFKVRGPVHDTMIMMHVYTGGGLQQYGLKPICKQFLEFDDEDEKALEDDTKKARIRHRKSGYSLATTETHGGQPFKADYWLADYDLLKDYAIKDAERVAYLFQLVREEIETDEGLYKTYKMEMELFWQVKAMEDRGVQVFPEEVKKLEKFYSEYMTRQKAVADKCGGKGMNFNSPKQKVQKFITEKKLIPLRLTEKGNPSCDADFMALIAEKDPLAKAILEHQGAAQGIKAFLKPYQKFMVEEDGIWVLHTNYKQCGTSTARFSASEPNLMQVGAEDSGKKRAEIALYPRRCFGPRKGYVWYLPDYSQLEVWLSMFRSGDENGIKALLSGKDFHGEVSRGAWGAERDYEENKNLYRKRGKITYFSWTYGGGKKKISLQLGCSEEEAGVFREKLNNQLPKLQKYMEIKSSESRNNGFIRGPFGRKYAVDPDFCYRAFNYDIQGVAAEIIKRVMILLAKKFDERYEGTKVLLTLHDELIIEVPLRHHSKRLMREIISWMQVYSERAGVRVPLPVSMKMVKSNWSKEIKLCSEHLSPNCKCAEK